MKIYLALLGFILLMSGCSAIQPSTTEYRINAQHKTKKVKPTSCKNRSLKVAEAFSSSSLMSYNMDYAIGDYKQFTYSQSQWSLSPNHAISFEIVNLLRDMNLFKTVQISKSRTRDDMILETSIDDFMQYYSEDKNSSFANVKISLTLIDTKTYKAVSSKSFLAKVDSKSLDAFGGVRALNLALKDVLNQSSLWLEEICK